MAYRVSSPFDAIERKDAQVSQKYENVPELDRAARTIQAASYNLRTDSKYLNRCQSNKDGGNNEYWHEVARELALVPIQAPFSDFLESPTPLNYTLVDLLLLTLISLQKWLLSLLVVPVHFLMIYLNNKISIKMKI